MGFSFSSQRFYSNQLTVHISQSSQRLPLLVSGHGLEPRLEFNPSVLELGPMLPYSIGDEAEVVVKNPCKFPIEFYSLEFDQQYLAEEKVRGEGILLLVNTCQFSSISEVSHSLLSKTN